MSTNAKQNYYLLHDSFYVLEVKVMTKTICDKVHLHNSTEYQFQRKSFKNLLHSHKEMNLKFPAGV